MAANLSAHRMASRRKDLFFFSPNIDGLLEQVERLLQEERLDEALSLAETACTKAPRNAGAHVARAAVLVELGRNEEAIEALETALRRDKRHPEALLGLADRLLERDTDESERVVALARQGRKVATRRGDGRLEGEFLLLEGIATGRLGHAADAIDLLDLALERLGPEPDVVLERAVALFEACRFDEARTAFEAIVETDPEEALAHHHLGLLAERRGDDTTAETCFAMARRLDPETCFAPCTLDEKDFDAVVEAALARLPAQVRRYLSNVAIAVEPFPADDDLEGGTLSPTILGVFRGSPLAEKASWDPWAHFPSSIVLYQRNLERIARDREELIEEIEVTLLHEVGHFLGFDEDDLEARGLD